MTRDQLHKAAMGLPGVTQDVKWGADHVYSVGGKMFCATDAAGSSLSLKVSDIAYEALTETGRARPAPYAARFKWVMFDHLSPLDAGEVEDWVRSAHGLVAARLPKKTRAALGL
ncbi:MmcQ/YjbR family DNA-binding protein [Phenylobacterium sp.]|uniref:MmcQ/YjbR family DNA-binding protein n=1 Tax=Phenylobacterium sp. TaxID=1871053 RepID=UPI0025E4F39E|nr:MmcQ/YjbR family DNA-binding protein [Phenylobacterium sp.]